MLATAYIRIWIYVFIHLHAYTCIYALEKAIQDSFYANILKTLGFAGAKSIISYRAGPRGVCMRVHMRMCTCTCVCTCKCTCVHLCVRNIYEYAYAYANMYVYMCVYVTFLSMQVCIFVHMYVDVCMNVWVWECACAYSFLTNPDSLFRSTSMVLHRQRHLLKFIKALS